jgi:hypothetical protein
MPNGPERRGLWEDGKRLRWLDEEGENPESQMV